MNDTAYRRFRNRVELQCAFDPARSPHGARHWQQVERIGCRLAGATGADREVVRLFSVLHDARRIGEESDPDHGRRAAEFAVELRDRLFQMASWQFELLYVALYWHGSGQTSTDPTIGACWDADRLDIVRFGRVPDPARISTAPGLQRAAELAGLRRSSAGTG